MRIILTTSNLGALDPLSIKYRTQNHKVGIKRGLDILFSIVLFGTCVKDDQIQNA